MRTEKTKNGGVKIFLTIYNTHDWAHRPEAAWPGSVISGRNVWAEFAANGDLVECSENCFDVPLTEFNACFNDARKTAGV